MNNKHLMIAAVVAGMIGSTTIVSSVAHAEDEMVCQEKNGCGTQGSCGGFSADGAKHDCAAHNSCKGNFRTGMSKEDCEKAGGKFMAMADAKKSFGKAKKGAAKKAK
jgi:hypothetical protein